MILQVLVVNIFLVASVELLGVPSYITPCKLSDPEFEKCALSTAKSFFQHIGQGDKDLKIQPFGSVKFPPLYFNNSRDFSLNITNALVKGMETIEVISIKKIPGKNRIECVLKCDAFVSGDFAIDSTYGGVAVAGKGPGIWDFNEVTINIAFEWQTKEKDGVKYLDVTNVDSDLDITSQKFSVDGDPGSNLNELLSPNLEAIFKELRPRNIYYSKRVFFMLTNILFTSVPYNELFLE